MSAVDRTARGGHTVRIGLTGPIGCGKSTVAAWLAELGAVVIDADDVAREVTAPGTSAAAAIAAEFGTDLLRADGSFDRAALGRIVFANAAALARLEAIKLVESGLAALCDEVWLVVCEPGTQLERLARRGDLAADAEARIAAQSDMAARLAPVATRVLDTSGTLESTVAAVRSAWGDALRATGAR